MGRRKVTMRDIAEACGVSVATVSHTLNHSGRENISDELRLKIIQTATKMKYDSASLKTRAEEPTAAIIVNLFENDTASKKMIYYDLAAELSIALEKAGYGSELVVSADMKDVLSKERLRNHEAWFMIDVDNGEFAKPVDGFYAPIILLESDDEQKLYCKIRADYKYIFDEAHNIFGENRIFLIMENIKSSILRDEIISCFSDRDVFINKAGANLAYFLEKHKGHKGVVLGEVLARQLTGVFPADDIIVLSYGDMAFTERSGFRALHVPNKNKAKKAVAALEAMLNYEYEKENDENRILMKPI